MTTLRRLRALAGLLTESIADDPHTNREIEKRLAMFPVEQRPMLLDALDAVKTAGRPLLPNEWARTVQQLYPEAPRDAVKDVITSAAREFKNVLRRAGGGVEWIKSHDMSVEPDVDAMTRSAVEGQVGMTYTALEIARALPSFTADDLGRALSQRLGLPDMITTAFAQHFIDQFRTYMQPVGPGSYRMAEEKPQTTADSMSLLRSIAADPQKGA